MALGSAIYRASTTTSFLAANTSTAAFFCIPGSAGAGSSFRTVLVRRIVLSGLSGTLGFNTINVRKVSTAPTGGTAVDLVKVPLDSSNPASSISNTAGSGVRVYTAVPTGGETLVGVIATHMFLTKSSTATEGSPTAYREITFPTPGEVYLRATAECITMGFAVAPATTGITMGIEVEWQEIQ